MNDVDVLRDQTYAEVKDMLKIYHKCVMIRPTGYGKTGILTRLMHEFKHVLYLYPTNVAKEAMWKLYDTPDDKTKITCISYHKLARMSEKELRQLSRSDLIVADECHRLGGRKTVLAVNKLLNDYCTNSYFCGATATPTRSDGYDVVNDLFKNHTISEYTTHDAFEDGILSKPYYCYVAMDYAADIDTLNKSATKEIDRIEDKKEKQRRRQLLDDHLKEIATLVNMPNVIKTTIDECIEDQTYMKFIVFCSSIKHIKECKREVLRWFREVYDAYELRSICISSENSRTRINAKRLNKLTYKQHTIDLIFCCDMLNMGYHVNDLTGIIMYRVTNSQIIFQQQFGRVLTSDRGKHGLIFDVVDNLHRKSLYAAMPYTTNDSDETTSVRSVCGWQKEDLIVTSFSATYEELVKKIVAEPMNERCRQAYDLWVAHGGRTDGDYAGIMGVLQQERNAKAINYGYANDMQAKFVPITPFARLKHVPVINVLETVFGNDDVDRYRTQIMQLIGEV